MAINQSHVASNAAKKAISHVIAQKKMEARATKLQGKLSQEPPRRVRHLLVELQDKDTTKGSRTTQVRLIATRLIGRKRIGQ